VREANVSILIVFATQEGQTANIARFVEDEARQEGHDVTLVDTSEDTTQVSFEGVDKVVLAAPVHERRHPEHFEVFLSSQRSQLEERPTLLLSVSLSAAFPEGLEDAQDYVLEMEMRTGFKPTREALVAGAVRASRYDYFASQVVQHVVLRGRDFDPDAGEHEFTDWEALAAVISGFLRNK